MSFKTVQYLKLNLCWWLLHRWPPTYESTSHGLPNWILSMPPCLVYTLSPPKKLSPNLWPLPATLSHSLYIHWAPAMQLPLSQVLWRLQASKIFKVSPCLQILSDSSSYWECLLPLCSGLTLFIVPWTIEMYIYSISPPLNDKPLGYYFLFIPAFLQYLKKTYIYRWIL